MGIVETSCDFLSLRSSSGLYWLGVQAGLSIPFSVTQYTTLLVTLGSMTSFCKCVMVMASPHKTIYIVLWTNICLVAHCGKVYLLPVRSEERRVGKEGGARGWG